MAFEKFGRLFGTSSILVLAMVAQSALAQDASGTPASRTAAAQSTTPNAQEASVGVDAAAPVQGTPAESGTIDDDIIVTGVRASLASAQSIKRNATQIVDSIVAEDIGKLPDNTVADALQRVTGVQVTRGAGEAGTVLIRGLPNVATVLNGREAFTGVTRGFALQDIPAELIAGVDVYKTSTPDLIEGGVAGLIDVRLRRPFDFVGSQIAASGRAVYSDQSKKWGYIGSGLVSQRWDTGIGEMGLLLAASYNKRQYQDQTAFDFVSSGSPVATPDTVGGLYTSGDRRRTALNASFQWRPSPDVEFYADGVFTRYDNQIAVDFFIGLPKAGTLTSVTPNASYPILADSSSTANAFTLTSKQAFRNRTDNYQGVVGGKWTLGQAVFNTEVTYNYSEVPNRNAILDTSFNVPRFDVDYDVGGTPRVTLTGADLTNPGIYTIRTLFDNNGLDTSEQIAWRNDLTIKPDSTVIETLKIGTRYTHRNVESQATASIPLAFPTAAGAPLASIPGFATLSPGGLVKGALGIDRFITADTDFLLNNTDQIRTLFGRPTGARAYEPNLAFFNREDTYAFYGQLGYHFDLGSMPLDGVAGARVVNTVEQLNGNNVSSKQNYLNVLPSINARLGLTEKLFLRAAAGKTVTRPEFAALNPLITLVPSGNTGTQQYIGTGSGGNPNLQPIKSTAYDASLEWYVARSTSLTAAGFYRDLSGYIQTYSQPEQFGGSYLVSRPRNAGNGYLAGAEVAYQQFFDFLPGALSGFGVQLNGTYMDGKTDDPINGGKQRIVNVSHWAYNTVAIYEKYGISARLAYNWRSSYVDSYNSGGVQASTILADPVSRLDFSGSYSPTSWLTLTFDATNILDDVYQDRFRGKNSVTGVYYDTPRDTRTYDRTIQIGARVKF
ncbi:TonB-dependent receptor [Sphingomonas mollis]|uniref:TonB-dependent receptor n=1 Tax=Sphingomonas mollis TaxID=2795726 RepID=A0ABS0XUK8_9SPHN|nr:TonB-dependent receptor [Sphingomonas sp. BT553]MBJ6123707.1 TonB-dependent receptor [Sphingomonas sp. BT553]